MPYKTFSMQYEVTQHLQIYGRWVLFSSVSSLLSKFLAPIVVSCVFKLLLVKLKHSILWQQALGLAYHRLGMFTAAVKVCCFQF